MAEALPPTNALRCRCSPLKDRPPFDRPPAGAAELQYAESFEVSPRVTAVVRERIDPAGHKRAILDEVGPR